MASFLKDPDLKRTMLYLDKSQLAFLAENAKEKRLNKSAIIRLILDDYMQECALR